ncbi:MAG: hypothetical protein A2W00_07815 [Candidatus Eisenbacteria bacterium RBG_16_71_46]|nr:MAG: hypothetical protein A2W00_07815 [Candidatus Eisenbacteria bacterium RBG_16_71_46]
MDTMDPRERERDERLTRMLRAAGAEADPALWTRARARIEALERTPGPLAWLMRPVGLAGSLALFVAAAGMSSALLRALPWQQPYEVVTLTDQLLSEGSYADAEPPAANGAAPGAARDSGGMP